MRMNVALIALMVALLLVVACVPKIADTAKGTAPDDTEKETADEPADVAADEPAEETEQAAETKPVETKPAPVSNEMTTDTEEKLKTNFPEGVKMGVSHPTAYKMNIGDKMVFGAAYRSMSRGPDEFQMNYTLYRAYDKSANSLLIDDADVKDWVSASMLDGKHFAYPVEKLAPGDERTYKFIVEVKPTYADGKPTKPGTYEFQFNVYNKDTNYYIFNPYANKKIVVQVAG